MNLINEELNVDILLHTWKQISHYDSVTIKL